ncbi:type II secretion system protein GspM [Pseudomonas sp. DTU_2021_1001937_2_SI_NGA_ILE_001]|uniref:type II secretion system protein GspM n=1 Tax=Pseudomonas sp. DTU_2021_1001937_2_SI_NGA_ILE_001 TaxID=3077589 RepID=UPI0028FC2B85|nr:type II secretion system protein GspM [Pseudomonas sp. DTU_2021_1001937_2_SI_NGA_ILE_001]WNW13327.1 type II secretion system protein GspM [Pseudomonas sp. DTU_2021_1001937_2_SI_NGA_ILE_001]
MRRELTARERRGAALIVLALVLWAAWWLLVQSWFLDPLNALDEQAEMLRGQQQRYAAILQQHDSLEQQLQAARRDPSSRTSLLPGEDPSAVAADLMQRSLDLVKAHADQGPGCEVTQRMPITPEHDGAEPYRQVKVSLTLECAMEPLARLLHDFEYGQPFLFVDNLSLRRATSAPARGGAGRLEVHLLLRGYMQQASSSAQAGKQSGKASAPGTEPDA